MQNIEVQVQLTPESCIEIGRFSPSYKIIYWCMMFILPIAPLWAHVKTRRDNSIIYNDNSEMLAATNIVDLLFTIAFILIVSLVFHYLWKYFYVKVIGMKIYNKYKKKNTLIMNVGYNSISGKFFFGRNDVDYEKKPKIISTKNYYLFYIKTKNNKEAYFFLPKHGNDELTSKVNEIIELCQKDLGIPIKHKS